MNTENKLISRSKSRLKEYSKLEKIISHGFEKVSSEGPIDVYKRRDVVIVYVPKKDKIINSYNIGIQKELDDYDSSD